LLEGWIYKQEVRDFKVWLNTTLPHIILMLLPVKLLSLNCIQRQVWSKYCSQKWVIQKWPKIKRNRNITEAINLIYSITLVSTVKEIKQFKSR
jgi:hypothetical protein